MKPRKKQFVKAADTRVPVQESIEAIKALVRRHGAAGFGVQEDYQRGRIVVSFVVNLENGGHLPVQIPVDVQRVYDKMYGHPNDPHKNNQGVIDARRDQAERTAWRQLHLIIDALLTAVGLGLMSLVDAFLAHTVVVSDDGRQERMGDYLERTQGVLAPGTRALLPSSTGGGT